MDKRHPNVMEPIFRTIDPGTSAARLDLFLVALDASLSRSEIQRQIRAGRVTVNGRPVAQPSYRLRAGEHVVWTPAARDVLHPSALDLAILYEDEDLIAIDKPAGLTVHPGAGTAGQTTLVEALLVGRNLPPSDDPARPGIVHRIDKETTGVLVVAKTERALALLKRQFADRAVEKTYLAVVAGTLHENEGLIDAPVGRDVQAPRRMCVCSTGRPAQTEFCVLRRRPGRTVALVRPRTGRTHQIRVHFQYIGHPVIGDALYGGPPGLDLLLHSWTLTVRHPATGVPMTFEAAPPDAFSPDDYDGCRPSARAASR